MYLLNEGGGVTALRKVGLAAGTLVKRLLCGVRWEMAVGPGAQVSTRNTHNFELGD